MVRHCVMALLILAAGCSKRGPAESLLDFVPANSVGALVVRADAYQLMRQQLEDDPAMHKELSDYLVSRVGIDLTKVTAALVVVTNTSPIEGALFLRLPGAGAPKWPTAGDAGAVPLYKLDEEVRAAVVPAGIIVGNEAGVRAMVAVAQKKAPALAHDSRLAGLLDADPASTLLIAADINAIPDPELKPFVTLYGISAATAGYSPNKVFAAVTGDPALLPTARDAANGLIKLMVTNAKEARDTAVKGDNTFLGATSIISYYNAVKFAPQLMPQLHGNRLSIEYALPSSSSGSAAGSTLLMGTAVVGVLAAVAIPAFMKYVRRSKSVEATMNVRKLFDSEVAYYETHHALSPSAGEWTPSVGCCQGAGQKCAPNKENFSAPGFTALDFSIDDPFYYQYRITTTKTGFTVEARGDLDCDGIYSLFRREGTITADGSISGGRGLYSENDIE